MILSECPEAIREREKQNSDPENNPNNPIQKKRKRFFDPKEEKGKRTKVKAKNLSVFGRLRNFSPTLLGRFLFIRGAGLAKLENEYLHICSHGHQLAHKPQPDWADIMAGEWEDLIRDIYKEKIYRKRLSQTIGSEDGWKICRFY